jgi:hypothetical protein
MKSIIALGNQSLFDIAIQYCGTVEAVFDFALLNGIGITQELIPGQTLLVANKDYGCSEIVNYFSNNGIKPATGITPEQLQEQPDGIGYMRIGSNFIVR